MNILAILPDSLRKPRGGVATHFSQFDIKDVEFTVIASDDLSEQICLPFDSGGDLAASTILADQAKIIAKAMSMDLNEIDLIHGYDASVAWASLLIAEVLNVPLVVSLQLSPTFLLPYYEPYIQQLLLPIVSLEMTMLKKANAVIHVSPEYYQQYSDLNSNSFLIPNSIDLEDWNMTEIPVLPGREEAFKVGYIGRYAEMKNVLSILEADQPDEMDLYFVGDKAGGSGDTYEQMKQNVDEHSNRYHLGKLLGQEKINWFHAMDAIIVPSTHEPFGIVCLEALASNCKLMSSFASGMGSYLTPEIALNCGITPETITQAFQKVKEWEPNRAEMLKICCKFNPKAVSELTGEVYQSVLRKESNV